MSQIWIVMPVYFDVPSFRVMRREIMELFPEARFVILDDSAGRDPEILGLRVWENCHIVEPPFNLGHQRGLVFALRKLAPQLSPQDIVITMDSDGEDPSCDLKDLVATIQEAQDPKHSLVLVQRTRRKETLLFKLFYFIYKMVFRQLTGTVIRSGNFAGFYGAFLKNYIQHPFFDLCYSSTLVRLKVEKRSLRRPRGSRIQGQSKMNFMSLIMHGIRMLMPFIDQIAIRSLMAFAALFAVSLGFAGLLVGMKLFSEQAISSLVQQSPQGGL